MRVYVCAYVCVRVHARARACVRACARVRVCVRACVCSAEIEVLFEYYAMKICVVYIFQALSSLVQEAREIFSIIGQFDKLIRSSAEEYV